MALKKKFFQRHILCLGIRIFWILGIVGKNAALMISFTAFTSNDFKMILKFGIQLNSFLPWIWTNFFFGPSKKTSYWKRLKIS